MYKARQRKRHTSRISNFHTDGVFNETSEVELVWNAPGGDYDNGRGMVQNAGRPIN
jgi:hypothetical protein